MGRRELRDRNADAGTAIAWRTGCCSAVARWYATAREVIEDLDALADDVGQRVARAAGSTSKRGVRVRYDLGVDA